MNIVYSFLFHATLKFKSKTCPNKIGKFVLLHFFSFKVEANYYLCRLDMLQVSPSKSLGYEYFNQLLTVCLKCEPTNTCRSMICRCCWCCCGVVVAVHVAAKLCADTHAFRGSPLPLGLGLGLGQPIVHHLPQCAARVRVVCLRMRHAFRLKYFTIIDVVSSRVRSIAYLSYSPLRSWCYLPPISVRFVLCRFESA